ncbi:phosphopyruvate hydratase, partial [Candidatus Gracilibacteria bacterium]|nr:phosphopyruvate hydratase [Candidatus Gracilibacteria bacterium]
MPKITKIESFEILDSRGNPTIEVEIILDNKIKGNAKVPSGASTGVHEALELRDGDSSRYNGNGVLKAIENIDTIISDEILGKVFGTFRELDKVLLKLDGTKNKSKLGANAILGVSLAFTKACANYENIELYQYIRNIIGEEFEIKDEFILPIPMMNIINGGEHADNSLDFQEFMIVPIGFESLAEKVRVGTEIFHTLKSILKEK